MSEQLPEPPPGGEDAENAELGEDIIEVEETNVRSFTAEEEAELREATDLLDALQLEEFVSADLQNAQQQPVENAGVANADVEQPAQQQLDAPVAQAMDRIRAQPDERQMWNTQRFIATFSGIGGLAGAAAVLYEIIKDAIANSSDANLPLPEATKAKIRALVKQWWARSDTDYWGDLATAADDPKLALTLEDQILFMNYTIDLSPVTPWIWQSTAQLVGVVNHCRAAYATSGSKTAAMYLLAPTLSVPDPGTQRPVLLPRPVAATVLRYALSYILIEPTQTPPA